MSESPKMNIGPALTVPLALATRAARTLSEHSEKFGVAGKLSAISKHPMADTAVQTIKKRQEVLWLVVGFTLIIYGAQFKNLFLCAQVVAWFCFDRVKESVLSIKDDVVTAYEKMTADAPAESNADANGDAKVESKQSQKRASKKDDKAAIDPAALKKKQEEDAAHTKKVLKSLDSDKVARTAFDIFTSFMACHMVMQGGSVQLVVVVHALVRAAKKRMEAIVEFTGLEDMAAWMDLFVSFVLYLAFGMLALTMAPLALSINIAVVGSHLVIEHGLKVGEAMGRVESAEKIAASVPGLAVLGGLTVFGTVWQLWAMMASSGMAWYFQIVYMPAVLAEFFVTLL